MFASNSKPNEILSSGDIDSSAQKQDHDVIISDSSNTKMDVFNSSLHQSNDE